ncbi:tetratricopeptide repeat protein [Desulfovibrio oxyclinae]|uniref:tetratricopeptide repeat protein n=1 Tax=Desulfovibrio oxyclinae TaxID=63560 RepID=UPI000374342E|nr:tetratricopeptide repeat protein [Desulfovibrio oxyclinae]
MTEIRLHRIVWLLAALMSGLLLATPAKALRVAYSPRGDSDRFTFTFDGSRPEFSVKRTGRQQITVQFPPGFWDDEQRPTTSVFRGAKLVDSVNISGNSLLIRTGTDAFGYLRLNVPGRPEFVLQVFRDPIGAKWKPESERRVAPAPRPEPEPQPTPPPEPEPQPEPQPASEPAPEPAPEVTEQPQSASDIAARLDEVQPTPVQQAPESEPAPQTEEQPVPQPQPEQAPAEAAPQSPAPVNQAAPGPDQPFYSVPYSVRSQVVAPPAPGEEPAPPQSVQSTVADTAPTASGEVRFQAQDRDAEDVKLSELDGEAPSQPVAPAPEQQAGGQVSPPPTQESAPAPVEPAQRPVPEPLAQDMAEADASTAPGAVSGAVVPPPSQNTAAEAAPPMAEEVAEPSVQEQVEAPAVTEPASEPEAAPEPDAETQAPAAESAEPANATQDEEPVTLPEGVPEKDLTPAQKQLLVQNKMYDAQSMMFNGELQEALAAYEELLKKSYLPEDMREEILYAVADIKMQLYRNDPERFYAEVNDAYQKALNANLESKRVPRALLNLGLVNLRAGNVPEAKAYFNILRNKYPDDPNIPAISYYWGDYYFKRGDYQEAADQLQYMIQKYPEHELVKSAAYLLAQALERTGYDKQAFQVVDYIDKRWPDFYMQRPEFLMLAGGIEERVGKLRQAKEHYFTYYNLNPAADRADIALAKIGDLYLQMDLQDPAKEIYQKAAKEFPDKEGGLIAKMRLAEEGIYDDPTLVQMGSVFDRPYNLQPVNIYKEIVEKHPESPLAPVAQLKLAMWYAFHNKNADALAAAQDFLDLFPESQLATRARELGDSVFFKAVPGLMEQEHYKRIVRYWEDYDFIGEGETKVDDDTKLMVATSYWKLGQPAKALALLEPYLDEQIPGVSEKALDLAVNVYLGEYNWNGINRLVKHAEENWDLGEKQLRQLNYARAMALQNMGEDIRAVPLWAELAKNPEVDPSFRGYAMYYLAKNAMRKQDLRRVFLYSQEALSLLLQTDGDPEKIKDAVLMSINATERSGRYEEALRWVREYDKYITPDHPEWAPTRLKLARIYRKAGAMDEWKSLLQDIVDRKPGSLQADLARSELETWELEQRAQEYAPQ